MRRPAIVAAVSFVSLFGCDMFKQKEPKPQDDLTIVVEADRSKLGEEEKQLEQKLVAFEQERDRLRSEKEQLMSSREQLRDQDKTQLQRLQESERRLFEREREMWKREATLEKERKTLSEQKTGMLAKLPAGSVAAPAVPDRSGEAVVREKSVAAREADLARREKDLGAREAELARREAEFLKLQASLSASRIAAIPRVVSTGGAISRKEAEKLLNKATKAMQQKGILWGDLPPEIGAVQRELAEARKKGENARVKDIAEQLDATVAAIEIDSGFIDRKFARLNELIKKAPPKDKAAVPAALRKATQLVGDGKYQAANRELNRIFGMLGR